MATSGTYYLDGPSLASATAVYTDAALTTKAPDGFYSNETIVREQSSGLLLPQNDCPSCGIACGSLVNPPTGGQGLYQLQFEAGSTPSDVGAIVIYFNPQSVPDGIRVLYDSVYYNALASPTDGYRKSTSGVADAFTILGSPSNTCIPTLPDTSSYTFYNGFTGGSWDVGSPSPQDVTINSGDDVRGGTSEYSTLVIPKTAATPSTVTVQVLGPCSGTAWSIEVACPVALDSFQGKSITGTDCTTADTTYYFAVNRGGTNTYPVVNNWVFSDENGQNVLADGNYFMDDNTVITVANGVVTAVVSCTTP
jgi:hypothetical protein